MRQLTVLAAALLPLTSLSVYADGLILRLPKDGASAIYKTEMTMDRNATAVASNGTLSVSSVGTTTVDAEECRWIEFKLELNYEGRKQDFVSTVLIPVKHLGKGKTPIDHVKKFWLKNGESEAREVEDAKGPMGGPLPVFLSGPIKEAIKLDPQVVESVLGNLPCEGVTGRLEVKQGEDDVEVDIETRTHDKAPFGVVTCTMKVNIIRGGETRQDIKMSLRLAEVAENAKSNLSNLD